MFKDRSILHIKVLGNVLPVKKKIKHAKYFFGIYNIIYKLQGVPRKITVGE